MSFLDDIQNQPQRTREIMFGLSVFITVLLIGMIWFRSFQKKLYVLMNPEDGIEKSLAIENTSVPSLFGFVLQTAGEVKGLVSGLLGDSNPESRTKNPEPKTESGEVYKLPLSNPK